MLCKLPLRLSGKEFICNAGDMGEVGLIRGLGRPPGEGNGNPLLYSCLGNPMDRGTWRDTVHRVTELDMTEQLTLPYYTKQMSILYFNTLFAKVINHLFCT